MCARDEFIVLSLILVWRFLPVCGTSRCASIDAGAQHTCVLLEDSTLRCWGGDAAGQLGYNFSSGLGETVLPIDMAPVAVAENIVQVSANDLHTCVLDSEGNVSCWGNNALGQLGNGPPGVPIGIPTSIDVGRRVTQLSVGYKHTCALITLGSFICWGNNAGGRLGRPEADGNIYTPSTSSLVDIVTPITRIASGGQHSCALLATHEIKCWGQNDKGQLGLKIIADDDGSPEMSQTVNVGGNVSQVVCGQFHTCALRVDGNVLCWGEGAHGKLGYNDTADVGKSEHPVEKGSVDVGGLAVDIATGADHTCCIISPGLVKCWGWGANGQLGYGDAHSIGDDEVPASVPPVQLLEPAIHIVAGFYHTCVVLQSFRVVCWGAGANGRLGYGGVLDIGDNSNLPLSMLAPVHLGQRLQLCEESVSYAPTSAPVGLPTENAPTQFPTISPTQSTTSMVISSSTITTASVKDTSAYTKSTMIQQTSTYLLTNSPEASFPWYVIVILVVLCLAIILVAGVVFVSRRKHEPPNEDIQMDSERRNSRRNSGRSIRYEPTDESVHRRKVKKRRRKNSNSTMLHVRGEGSQSTHSSSTPSAGSQPTIGSSLGTEYMHRKANVGYDQVPKATSVYEEIAVKWECNCQNVNPADAVECINCGEARPSATKYELLPKVGSIVNNTYDSVLQVKKAPKAYNETSLVEEVDI